MALIDFLASTKGRIVRIVAGILLVVLGPLVVTGAAGFILAVVGLVPLLAGLLDYCVFAPLCGAPFSGKAIRNR